MSIIMSEQKTATALLVEDDSSWKEILCELLQDCGFEVDQSDRLEKAETMIHERAHRVAVVDLSLAGPDHRNQDGLKVLDLLAECDPHCKTILLTGFATVELAVEVITQGKAVTCLRKENFSRTEFCGLLEKARRSAPEPIADSEVELEQPQGSCLVVEDDAGWREVLSEILHQAGLKTRECASFAEARTYLHREDYQLVVADLSLSSSVEQENQDGLVVLEVAGQKGIPAVVVSGRGRPALIEQVLSEEKAVGFFEKNSFDREAFRQMVESAVRPSELDVLTEREREVLETLAEGLTNQQIADKLFISTNTVKRHLKSVFEKLGVSNRASAAALVTRETR